mmetsp:Transcript_42562/g.102583  ORF Transcript_42562/g.102583 Transcript_42562/m.102583 type:complete len:496 (-) Transcript_42562:397-1884(-)
MHVRAIVSHGGALDRVRGLTLGDSCLVFHLGPEAFLAPARAIVTTFQQPGQVGGRSIPEALHLSLTKAEPCLARGPVSQAMASPTRPFTRGGPARDPVSRSDPRAHGLRRQRVIPAQASVLRLLGLAMLGQVQLVPVGPHGASVAADSANHRGEALPCCCGCSAVDQEPTGHGGGHRLHRVPTLPQLLPVLLRGLNHQPGLPLALRARPGGGIDSSEEEHTLSNVTQGDCEMATVDFVHVLHVGDVHTVTLGEGVGSVGGHFDVVPHLDSRRRAPSIVVIDFDGVARRSRELSADHSHNHVGEGDGLTYDTSSLRPSLIYVFPTAVGFLAEPDQSNRLLGHNLLNALIYRRGDSSLVGWRAVFVIPSSPHHYVHQRQHLGGKSNFVPIVVVVVQRSAIIEHGADVRARGVESLPRCNDLVGDAKTDGYILILGLGDDERELIVVGVTLRCGFTPRLVGPGQCRQGSNRLHVRLHGDQQPILGVSGNCERQLSVVR